jgi:hypothetical protein
MKLKMIEGRLAPAGMPGGMAIGPDGKLIAGGGGDVFIAGDGAAAFGQAGANWVMANPVGGRGRVSTWQDDDNLFVMRFVGKSPTYLLALSRKDGRTLYDGPVMTREQQAALPAEIAEQFAMLKDKPELAKELGAEKAETPKPQNATPPTPNEKPAELPAKN